MLVSGVCVRARVEVCSFITCILVSRVSTHVCVCVSSACVHSVCAHVFVQYLYVRVCIPSVCRCRCVDARTFLFQVVLGKGQKLMQSIIKLPWIELCSNRYFCFYFSNSSFPLKINDISEKVIPFEIQAFCNVKSL